VLGGTTVGEKGGEIMRIAKKFKGWINCIGKIFHIELSGVELELECFVTQSEKSSKGRIIWRYFVI
jgi:hypothetical protein